MFLMLLCLFCQGLHVPPARLSLHARTIVLWTLRFCVPLLLRWDPSTSSGPYCGFTSTAPSESSAPVFLLCTLHGVLLTPLASLSLSIFVRVLNPVLFESLAHVVVTRQCPAFCFLHHLCVTRLPARQRACPCTVAVKLRQCVAPSGCS